MPFVNPRDDRHQLDCPDAQLAQMRQHRRMRQRPHRAALPRRHVRMTHGEGADVDLVDQLPGTEDRRRGRQRRQHRRDDRLGHERRRIGAPLAKPGIMDERSVKLGRARVDQQLGRIERRRPVGTIAVAGANRHGQVEHPCLPVPLHRVAGFRTRRVEQAQPHGPGGRRSHAETVRRLLRHGLAHPRRRVR